MEQCLTFSPKRRIEVGEALRHPYLQVSQWCHFFIIIIIIIILSGCGFGRYWWCWTSLCVCDTVQSFLLPWESHLCCCRTPHSLSMGGTDPDIQDSPWGVVFRGRKTRQTRQVPMWQYRNDVALQQFPVRNLFTVIVLSFRALLHAIITYPLNAPSHTAVPWSSRWTNGWTTRPLILWLWQWWSTRQGRIERFAIPRLNVRLPIVQTLLPSQCSYTRKSHGQTTYKHHFCWPDSHEMGSEERCWQQVVSGQIVQDIQYPVRHYMIPHRYNRYH